MAAHLHLLERLAVLVFFANPHSPWQRGIKEHPNGLVRPYFPTGRKLSSDTQRELNTFAHRLNTRPRICLKWMPLNILLN
jgi:IS30 family transposase